MYVCNVIDQDAVPYFKLREWPNLVGVKGEEAVAAIKEETGRFELTLVTSYVFVVLGLSEVFVVTERSKLSKDMRYDRVCIYVDKEGKVLHVPRTG